MMNLKLVSVTAAVLILFENFEATDAPGTAPARTKPFQPAIFKRFFN
jgi:hypothetical protein